MTVVNATGTIVSIFLIERVGRRGLILAMLPFTVLAWVTAAIGMGLTGSDSTAEVGGIVATAGIILFLLSFSTGMSSTPWTINSEIYPISVIGTANALSASVNWTANFVIGVTFPLVTGLGVPYEVGVYLTLALFAVLCFIFTYKLIPETANKSID